MSFHDSIELRPRFEWHLKVSKSDLLNKFKNGNPHVTGIKSSVVEPHIFLKITKNHHLWSPQLHLEIVESDLGVNLHGVFGPNPKLWTFFMFLHFLIAGIFVGCGVWTYVNWTFNQSFLVPVLLMILMTTLWITLYLIGRLGKQKGRDQMKLLYDFTKSII